ncbi:MFS transporter [Alphaproteobacteria bacterium]|nr:MFS transporter [Pelagibacteraceae bacterium]MDC3270057.1 MFS transporter [Alphaproteobacteria bacterium]
MILNSIKNYLDFNVVNPSVKYLSLVAFFTGIILSYFYTVLVIIQKYAGYSEFTIGVVASFGPLGLIFSGFFTTKLLKKFGFYKIIFIATSIQGFCIAIMLEFLNPIYLAFWFFILGMMGGLTWMTMDTWVNVVSNNSNRGKSIGIYNSSVTTGLAMGPLVVGLFGISDRGPLIICLLLIFLKIGVLISIKKYVNQVSIPDQSTKMKFSIIFISPFIFLAIFFAGIEDSAFLSLFPAFMINDFFSEKQIGIYIFVGGIFGVLCQPFVGALSDHFNKRLLVFALLLAHVSWLILLKFSNSNEILIIIALMISGFASTSLYTVTLAYLGERINVSDIAFATSLFIIIYEIGEYIGPIIVGFNMNFFGNAGFTNTLLIFAFFSIIFGIFRSLFHKK